MWSGSLRAGHVVAALLGTTFPVLCNISVTVVIPIVFLWDAASQ